MKTSVIVSTYNSPQWLEKVLLGFHYQEDKDFELLVADDGSDKQSAQLIRRFACNTKMAIRHIWQPDEGFQKCRILNRAILASEGDYIIVTDGDCIPRKDFVSVHKQQAEPGFYLSGGYFKLPMSLSRQISKHQIASGQAFNIEWLIRHGLKKSHKCMKLTARNWRAALYNHLTPTRRTWNGHNASTWKEHIVAVNGFDERMQYGGEDCELGDRLRNIGIKAKQIRYSAICVHLDHERGYVTSDMKHRNKAIRHTTRKQRMRITEFGLTQRWEADSASL